MQSAVIPGSSSVQYLLHRLASKYEMLVFRNIEMITEQTKVLTVEGLIFKFDNKKYLCLIQNPIFYYFKFKLVFE